MESFGKHMFTPSVQAEQDKLGMRERYAKAYEKRLTGPLPDDAKAFIESRDNFYLATVSETGWPYVQHRGGARGFLKVIAEDTVGFADYTGNKQMISRGNLSGDDRVSLILMDYPNRARLKLIGHMSMMDAADDPDLAKRLATDDDNPVERLATIRLIAMDWNCPKYITPRFTQDEVTALVAPHLADRDRKIAVLSARLQELGEDPESLLRTTP